MKDLFKKERKQGYTLVDHCFVRCFAMQHFSSGSSQYRQYRDGILSYSQLTSLLSQISRRGCSHLSITLGEYSWHPWISVEVFGYRFICKMHKFNLAKLIITPPDLLSKRYRNQAPKLGYTLWIFVKLPSHTRICLCTSMNALTAIVHICRTKAL